jgi:cellulose biosynthesis protein BcsQ
MDTLTAVFPTPPPVRVIAVVSNKGGVGKTTVATNLAIYLRALCEDLPVLILGLDDQSVLDRMFALQPLGPEDPNLKHVWAERSLDRAVLLGEYGVHFVPSPLNTEALKARARDANTLAGIVRRSKWEGVVILDTKSDLEALTQNALHAADRVILPVADRASLDEAAKVFTLLDRERRADRARVLLTLVDGRARPDPASGLTLKQVLEREIEKRGWPRFATHLSRSPRAEALISVGGSPLSILHHARGTAIHDQMRRFTEEVLRDLGVATPPTAALRRPAASAEPRRTAVEEWKSALLRGLRGR